MKRISFLYFSTALALCGASAASPAFAMDGQVNFSIPAMPLGDALQLYAVQSGEQIVIPSGTGTSKRSVGVAGPVARDAALRQLLSGTGLRAVRSQDGVISLRKIAMASAQPSAPGTPTARSAAVAVSQASEPAPASTETESGVADIIVTAQRFSETAQKTPLILTVVQAEELQGVTDLRQLTSAVPSLQISGSGTTFQTFIRGVGSVAILAGQEPAIAYQVDGVYLFTSSMVTPVMYDLERIEVLKGPQGTLYGRNASGGAVNLITTGARLAKTEGYLEGEIGNYDRRRIAGALNMPLGETLAVRIAGQHVEHDGYLSDGTADGNLTSGRLRILWEPSSTVSLRIGGDVSRQRPVGPGTSLNPNPTNDKWLGQLDPRAMNPPSAFTAFPPYPAPFLKNDQWSLDAQLDVDLGFATLTVLPAYRHENLFYHGYAAGFEDTQRARTREKTIEARLANRSDRLQWVVGAYYLKVDQVLLSNPRQDRGPTPSSIFALQTPETTSYAFFGEATFGVSDSLRLIGGLRYTHDEQVNHIQGNETLPSPPQTPAFNPRNPVTNPTGEPLDFEQFARTSDSAVTWKGGAELDLSPSSMLFATVSRGFKGGGTFANRGSVNTSYDPEYVTAFELGSRNRFFDNTLQINGELFYWKLKDQQLTFLSFNESSQFVLQTINAAKATMYGGSLDVIWRPTRNDTLHGSVEYNKSEYDSFTVAQPRLAILPSSTCEKIFTSPSPISPATLDCSGKPMVRAPKWIASAGYQRIFDLGNGGEITVDGDMNYASGRYVFVNFTPLGYQKGQATFNGSLSYTTPGKRLTVTAWIRNIGNERIMTNAIQSNNLFARPALAPPRTYGINARVAF